MFRLFRRRPPEPRTVTPDEALAVVERKLREPGLTPLERGVLQQIKVQCQPTIPPSPLSQGREKVRDSA